MCFGMKSTLKSNRYHTLKHTLKQLEGSTVATNNTFPNVLVWPKVVKNTFLTRHEKYNINLDSENEL